MYAQSLHNVRAAELLVAHGADPMLKDWAGRTAGDYERLQVRGYPFSRNMSNGLGRLPASSAR